MKYRRLYSTGGCYFFTVNLQDRTQGLLVEHIDILREAIRYVKRKYPFHINAWVILPDHMHAIWTLPPDDHDYSKRWQQIKKRFSKRLPKIEERSLSNRKNNERGIWQRRFWEHQIRNEKDYQTHFNYVHYNPIKHGWVDRVMDWPYSTFHVAVKQGIYSPSWLGEE